MTNVLRETGPDAECRMPGSVRPRLGRDGRIPLRFLNLVRNSVGVGPAGFGMGSVGKGGSVVAAQIRPGSSPYSRLTGLSELLKIRVSMVRFRPWPPFLLRLSSDHRSGRYRDVPVRRS